MEEALQGAIEKARIANVIETAALIFMVAVGPSKVDGSSEERLFWCRSRLWWFRRFHWS